jgi:hypothetical protein
MQTEGSLLSSQEPATGPCPDLYLPKYSVWINHCCFYNRQFLCRTLYMHPV